MTKKFMTKKGRIEKLLEAIGADLYEREEILPKCLLAALSGESTFLFGPPGTAKSLIARRVAKAFKDTSYFECLMSRFTTPEEVFGPVSLKMLKEDRYLRHTEGSLPKASFAFLDEIWKSGPGILNTLLTIVNERKFRNDGKVGDVPLKGIIAASNETPEPNQGLDALYDRFIVRMNVTPLKDKDNFMALLDGDPAKSEITVDANLAFGEEEWEQMLAGLSEVHFSDESKNVLHAIRKKIEEYNQSAVNGNEKTKSTLYISDRRWQKIARILKMAAYLCDRKEVLPIDLTILSDCLWDKPSQHDDVQKMVIAAVEDSSNCQDQEFEDLKSDIAVEEDLISNTRFFADDGYDEYPITKIGGIDHFQCVIVDDRGRFKTVCVPCDMRGALGTWHPFNVNGGEVESVRYTSIGTDFLFEVEQPGVYGGKSWKAAKTMDRESHKKGDFRPIKPEVRKKLQEDVRILKKRLVDLTNKVKSAYEVEKEKMSSPFVTKQGVDVVLSARKEHLDELERGRVNLERIALDLENDAYDIVESKFEW